MKFHRNGMLLLAALSLLLSEAAGVQAQNATPPSAEYRQLTIQSNAFNLLPAGEPGQVVVLAAGTFPQRGISIPVLIKNNTDKSVYDVKLKAEIKDSQGNLVGVENEAYGTFPTVLNPGDIGLTAIQPDPDKLPANIDYSFKVTYDSSPPNHQYYRIVNFGDLTFTDNRVLGEVTNPSSEPFSDVTLFATCLNNEGTPFNFTIHGVDEVLESEVSTTFQLDIHGDPCKNYLITGYGSD